MNEGGLPAFQDAEGAEGAGFQAKSPETATEHGNHPFKSQEVVREAADSPKKTAR